MGTGNAGRQTSSEDQDQQAEVKRALDRIDTNLLDERKKLITLSQTSLTDAGRQEALSQINILDNIIADQAGRETERGATGNPFLQGVGDFISVLGGPARALNQTLIELTDVRNFDGGNIGSAFDPREGTLNPGFGEFLEVVLPEDTGDGLFDIPDFVPGIGGARVDGRDIGGLAGDLIFDPLNLVGGAGLIDDTAKAGFRTLGGLGRGVNRVPRASVVDNLLGQGTPEAIRAAAIVQTRGVRGLSQAQAAAVGLHQGLTFGIGRLGVAIPYTRTAYRAISGLTLPGARTAATARKIRRADEVGSSLFGNQENLARTRAALQAIDEGTPAGFSNFAATAAARSAAKTGRGVGASVSRRLLDRAFPDRATARATLETIREGGLDFAAAVERGDSVFNGINLTPIRESLDEARAILRGSVPGFEGIDNYFPRFRRLLDELGVDDLSRASLNSVLRGRRFSPGGDFLGETLSTGSLDELTAIAASKGFDLNSLFQNDGASVLQAYFQQVGRIAGQAEAAQLLARQGFGLKQVTQAWLRSDVPAALNRRLIQDIGPQWRDAVVSLDSVGLDRVLRDPAGGSAFAARRAAATSGPAARLWGAASEALDEAANARLLLSEMLANPDDFTEEVTRALAVRVNMLAVSGQEAMLRGLLIDDGFEFAANPQFLGFLEELAGSPAISNRLAGIMNRQSLEIARLSGHYLPDDIAEILTTVAVWQPQHVATRFLRGYNKFFKRLAILTPGFNVRNLYGGLAQEWSVSGVNPFPNGRRFLRDYKRFVDGETDFPGYETIRRIMDSGDVDAAGGGLDDVLGGSSGRFGDAASETTFRAGQIMNRIGRALDETTGRVASTLFAQTNRPIKVETFLRGSHMYGKMLAGESYELARDSMFRVHFDYRDLSKIEQATQASVIPFYTFRARNMALQLEILARRPGVASRLVNYQQRLQEQHSNPLQPDYFNDGIALPSPTDDSFVFTPDLPVGDLLGVARDLEAGIIRGPIRMIALDTSPLLKLPIEIQQNQDFFRQAPINSEFEPLNELLFPIVDAKIPGLSYDAGNQTFSGPGAFAANAVQDLGDLLGFGIAVGPDGTILVDERLNYSLTQTLPVLGQIRRLLPNDARYDARAEAAWLSYFGNFTRKITPLDERNETYRRLDEVNARLREVNIALEGFGVTDGG